MKKTKLGAISPINKCYLMVAILFLLSLVGYYPGEMSSDSFTIFHQALNNEYSLHSSPIFGYTWHLLNYISTGPFIMLIFQQMLLWATVIILVDSWYKKYGYSRIIWIFILVPFFPSIFKLSPILWKDVNFAFSYALTSSLIIRYMLLDHLKPHMLTKALILLLIFYGGGCKFQGLYLLPLMVFWYISVFFKTKYYLRALLTVLISAALIFAVVEINKKLANDDIGNSRFGWQPTKFYDLLYISFRQDKPILPQYILEDKRFNFEELKAIYRMHGRMIVEYLIYKNSTQPIKNTIVPYQQEQIMDTWYRAIKHFPLDYLFARFSVVGRILITPIHRYKLNKDLTGEFLTAFDKYTYKWARDNFVGRSFQYFNRLFAWLTPLIFCLPVMIFYMYQGIKISKQKAKAEGQILLLLNGMALFFIVVMTFTAVCFDYRYLFICHVLFHFSHPFAWKVIRESKNV